MGQTDEDWDEYGPFADCGDLSDQDPWNDETHRRYEFGEEPYGEVGFCEMCGQDYGAVLRSDGRYRCPHCDVVWNG